MNQHHSNLNYNSDRHRRSRSPCKLSLNRKHNGSSRKISPSRKSSRSPKHRSSISPRQMYSSSPKRKHSKFPYQKLRKDSPNRKLKHLQSSENSFSTLPTGSGSHLFISTTLQISSPKNIVQQVVSSPRNSILTSSLKTRESYLSSSGEEDSFCSKRSEKHIDGNSLDIYQIPSRSCNFIDYDVDYNKYLSDGSITSQNTKNSNTLLKDKDHKMISKCPSLSSLNSNKLESVKSSNTTSQASTELTHFSTPISSAIDNEFTSNSNQAKSETQFKESHDEVIALKEKALPSSLSKTSVGLSYKQFDYCNKKRLVLSNTQSSLNFEKNEVKGCEKASNQGATLSPRLQQNSFKTSVANTSVGTSKAFGTRTDSHTKETTIKKDLSFQEKFNDLEQQKKLLLEYQQSNALLAHNINALVLLNQQVSPSMSASPILTSFNSQLANIGVHKDSIIKQSTSDFQVQDNSRKGIVDSCTADVNGNLAASQEVLQEKKHSKERIKKVVYSNEKIRHSSSLNSDFKSLISKKYTSRSPPFLNHSTKSYSSQTVTISNTTVTTQTQSSHLKLPNDLLKQQDIGGVTTYFSSSSDHSKKTTDLIDKDLDNSLKKSYLISPNISNGSKVNITSTTTMTLSNNDSNPHNIADKEKGFPGSSNNILQNVLDVGILYKSSKPSLTTSYPFSSNNGTDIYMQPSKTLLMKPRALQKPFMSSCSSTTSSKVSTSTKICITTPIDTASSITTPVVKSVETTPFCQGSVKDPRKLSNMVEIKRAVSSDDNTKLSCIDSASSSDIAKSKINFHESVKKGAEESNSHTLFEKLLITESTILASKIMPRKIKVKNETQKLTLIEYMNRRRSGSTGNNPGLKNRAGSTCKIIEEPVENIPESPGTVLKNLKEVSEKIISDNPHTRIQDIKRDAIAENSIQKVSEKVTTIEGPVASFSICPNNSLQTISTKIESEYKAFLESIGANSPPLQEKPEIPIWAGNSTTSNQEDKKDNVRLCEENNKLGKENFSKQKNEICSSPKEEEVASKKPTENVIPSHIETTMTIKDSVTSEKRVMIKDERVVRSTNSSLKVETVFVDAVKKSVLKEDNSLKRRVNVEKELSRSENILVVGENQETSVIKMHSKELLKTKNQKDVNLVTESTKTEGIKSIKKKSINVNTVGKEKPSAPHSKENIKNIEVWKGFLCKLCEKTFSQTSSLYRHQREKHSSQKRKTSGEKNLGNFVKIKKQKTNKTLNSTQSLKNNESKEDPFEFPQNDDLEPVPTSRTIFKEQNEQLDHSTVETPKIKLDYESKDLPLNLAFAGTITGKRLHKATVKGKAFLEDLKSRQKKTSKSFTKETGSGKQRDTNKVNSKSQDNKEVVKDTMTKKIKTGTKPGQGISETIQKTKKENVPQRHAVNVTPNSALSVDKKHKGLSLPVQPVNEKTFDSIVKTIITPLTTTVRKKFKCKICSTEFLKERELIKHSAIHKGRTYDCYKCEDKFTTMRALTKHLVLHDDVQIGITSSDRPHDCDKCDETFETENQLLVHLKIHDKQETHVCTICSANYHCLKELYSHISKSHSKDIHQVLRCSHCNQCFGQFEAFCSHLMSNHKMNSKEAALAARNKGILPEEYKHSIAEKPKIACGEKHSKVVLPPGAPTDRNLSTKIKRIINTDKRSLKSAAGNIKAKAVIQKRKKVQRELKDNAKNRSSSRLKTFNVPLSVSIESENDGGIINSKDESSDANHKTIRSKEIKLSSRREFDSVFTAVYTKGPSATHGSFNQTPEEKSTDWLLKEASLPLLTLENIFDRAEKITRNIKEVEKANSNDVLQVQSSTNLFPESSVDTLKIETPYVEDFSHLSQVNDVKLAKMQFENAERTARMLIRNQRKSTDKKKVTESLKKKQRESSDELKHTGNRKKDPLKLKVHIKMNDLVTTDAANLLSPSHAGVEIVKKGKKKSGKKKLLQSSDSIQRTVQRRKSKKFYVYEDELFPQEKEKMFDASIGNGFTSSSIKSTLLQNYDDHIGYFIPPDIDYDKDFNYQQIAKSEVLTEDSILSSLLTLTVDEQDSLIMTQIDESRQRLIEKEVQLTLAGLLNQICEAIQERCGTADDTLSVHIAVDTETNCFTPSPTSEHDYLGFISTTENEIQQNSFANELFFGNSFPPEKTKEDAEDNAVHLFHNISTKIDDEKNTFYSSNEHLKDTHRLERINQGFLPDERNQINNNSYKSNKELNLKLDPCYSEVLELFTKTSPLLKFADKNPVVDFTKETSFSISQVERESNQELSNFITKSPLISRDVRKCLSDVCESVCLSPEVLEGDTVRNVLMELCENVVSEVCSFELNRNTRSNTSRELKICSPSQNSISRIKRKNSYIDDTSNDYSDTEHSNINKRFKAFTSANNIYLETLRSFSTNWLTNRVEPNFELLNKTLDPSSVTVDISAVNDAYFYTQVADVELEIRNKPSPVKSFVSKEFLKVITDVDEGASEEHRLIKPDLRPEPREDLAVVQKRRKSPRLKSSASVESISVTPVVTKVNTYSCDKYLPQDSMHSRMNNLQSTNSTGDCDFQFKKSFDNVLKTLDTSHKTSTLLDYVSQTEQLIKSTQNIRSKNDTQSVDVTVSCSDRIPFAQSSIPTKESTECAMNSQSNFCLVCLEQFPSPSSCEGHLRNKHGVVISFTCIKCKDIFSSFKEKLSHTCNKQKQSHKCGNCSITFSTSRTLHRHQMFKHSNNEGKQYKCSYCCQVFTRQSYVRLHERRKHKVNHQRTSNKNSNLLKLLTNGKAERM